MKTKAQATKEAEELQVEVDRLKAELEAYKRKEAQWLRRWQQIAFHVRQKGIQMVGVDKAPLEELSCLLILKLRKSSGRLTKRFHLQENIK